MKNKMMKILGIALTLAVLVGLLVPAMPASAGTLSWTTADLPSKFIDGSNITAVGVSPDGGTILVYNGKYSSTTEAGDNNGFAKSTDGGVSFNAKGVNDDDELFKNFDVCSEIVFSPKYSTDKVIVIVADGDAYISYDAGKSFDVLEDAPTGVVRADVSYDSNGKLSVVVGTADTVDLYTEKSGTRWMPISTANGFIEGDVLDVKFSPKYDDDAQVLVLSNSDVAVLQNVVVEKDIDSMNWNESYKPVVFEADSDSVIAINGYLAIEDDYNANGGKVFIALDTNEDVDANGKDEVFRVAMSTGSSNKKATLLKANEEDDINTICSLNYEAGKLAVGTNDNIVVNAKADTSTSADDWTSALDEAAGKTPSGVNMLVVFSTDAEELYVATENYVDIEDEVNYDIVDGTFGSVFASSTDFQTFDGISLINVDDAKIVTVKNMRGVGKETQYATMNANIRFGGGPPYAAVQILFKTTDSGKNWKEIKSNVNVLIDDYTGDDIDDPDMAKMFNDISVMGDDVWLPAKKSKILHSSDGGKTWDDTINVRTKDDLIYAFAGGPDYWVGGPDGEIFKNNSRTAIVIDDMDNHDFFALITIPGFFVILTTPDGFGPPNGPIFFSADGGVTFKKLGDKDITTSTFDIPGKLIYGIEDGTNDLFKYDVESGTDWVKVCDITLDGYNYTPANINLTGNGVLYVKGNSVKLDEDGEDTTTVGPQYIRTVELKLATPKFEAIPESSTSDWKNAGVQPGPTDIVEADGNNTLYKVADYFDGTDEGVDADIPKGKIMSKLMTYTDTLSNGPAISAPAANAQITSSYTFQWNAVTAGSKKITYGIQLATDDKFQGKAVDTTTSATSYYAIGLIPGKQYYARVKVSGVAGDKTLSSFWSPTVPFIVKLDEINSGNSTWIAPAAGATSVSQTPNFQWGSVTGATGYELVIDGGAAIALTDTIYTMTTPLAYGSTHTWKVRAISGTTAGDWVSGVFTVMAAPAATSTVPPVTTTAATPKFFDPNSGQYFNSQAELDAFQAAWKTNHPAPTPPTTPAYIWVIIVIGAILVIAVVVLIARTRRV